MKKSVILLICVILLTIMMPMQAFATGTYSAGEPLSMTLTYTYNGAPLTGAKFDFYLLAKRTSSTQLKVTDAFKDFPVDILDDDADYSILAETLKPYIYLDNIEPSYTGEINELGSLVLTTEANGLKHGRYLIIPHLYETDTHIYEAQAVIFDLPTIFTENEWVYSLIINPKAIEVPKIEGDETIDRKVLKVWDDEGYENQRPSEIKVYLLKDGVTYAEATLNTGNNWRYTWENLDDNHEWLVVEEKPDDYIVQIEQMGSTIRITNTYDIPIVTPTPPVVVTPTPTPPVDVTPTPTPPVDVTPTPTPPVDVTPTPTVTPTPPPKLPQTGQLWWPVPILVTGGMLLIIVGLLLRKGSVEDE